MSRTKVFVSYSRKDIDWLERLSEHIAVLERRGLVDVWSDTRIEAGADWEREIDEALTTAKVAVLLVSPAFLASRYIWEREMPRVFAHSSQGMKVLPLIVRPCALRLEEELARFQTRPNEPLSLGSEGQVDSDLSAFAYELAALIGRSPVAASVPSTDTISTVSANQDSGTAGEWTGYYNRTRPVRVLIQEVKDDAFGGIMEYPSEGTITNIKGSIHSRWSPDDPVWVQIGGINFRGKGVAVSFQETDYEKKGSSSISFGGDYHAIVHGEEMVGAWFSGQRLVGSLTLQRISRYSISPTVERPTQSPG